MIPSPPSGKPVAFYDTECYPNYWLLKIRPKGGQVFTFSLRAGQRFDGEAVEKIGYLMNLFTVISFNGIYYDVPMIACALDGYSCEQLKWVSNQIIVEERKYWDLGISEWKPLDHIDIMEVLPGAGSQKLYAGRIHYKTMRDLPYNPEQYLTENEILEVDSYCENDLGQLEALYMAVKPQLSLRVYMGEKYGIDLRSKSDAQVGETIIKAGCEQILARKLYKSEIDWNMSFRYDPPDFLRFESPELQSAFARVKDSIFTLAASGSVKMPQQLEGLEIPLGKSIYRLGIGGLHSKDKREVHKSDEESLIISPDVASYYPSLILNSGEYPAALGPTMLTVYGGLKDNRLEAKRREKKLKVLGNTKDPAFVEGYQAHCDNEGGKVAINGPYGKLGSIYSILHAPKMLIQTTVTGQLSLLMLIEWYEMAGIPVISANTDGIVIKCPRSKLDISANLIKYWEYETGLEMETTEYKALYIRDVNNYFAIEADGEIKRKGEYGKTSLMDKKSPDVEICGDAVAEFLLNGTPIAFTIASCRDIRKFVTIQNVAGGAVKLWGEGPRKDAKVKDMVPTIEANGWVKSGHKWRRGETIADPRTAYKSCFQPQQPEFLGKVIRWFYSTEAPGPIIYNSNGNHVGSSYGAKPCMTLPESLPQDIDYSWYVANCEKMLRDVGYYGQSL